MTDRTPPVARLGGWLLAALALILILATGARADVLGRLRVVVRDSAGAPLRASNVTLHDPTGVRADIPLVTAADGTVLSPPLENHAWQVSAQFAGRQTATQQVIVAADATSDVNFALAARVLTGRTTVTLRSTSPADRTDRNQAFTQKIPATGGNPQSLQRLLVTTPGFVKSSVNVAHPRGEHASTSIYVNGFLLPGVLQGRAGPQISPSIIQDAQIQTGGFAPEYGSETAAVLNLSLRSGTIVPFQSFSLQHGDYATSYGQITVGGQAGPSLEPGATGPAPSKFRYLLDLSDRYTANALEAPQPNNQTAHNHGTSDTLFGNFEYLPGSRDQITLLVNSAPAHTQIANRTGLPSKYAPVGQGFGYGGARNADGGEAGTTPDPGVVGSQNISLPSQQDAGQDVYQNDDNSFGALNYRHTFSPTLTGLLSLGINHSGLDIKNNNPSINLNSLNPDGTLSVIDNSIEFNPTILRSNTQNELSGSLTQLTGAHTVKAGFLFQSQTGDELYQFTPQSQLALDALAAVQTGGPQLAPSGTGQVDAGGSPVLDALGNQVYLITPGATTPVLRVHRSGYYNAGYVQDTWRINRQLTANYGLRLDGYGQKQNLGQSDVNTAYLSPRLNLSYALASGTTFRLSYDKLFTQPPLAQGAIVGTALRPQITDAYDASIEHRITPLQTAKVSVYYKNDHNQNDTGILIPYTQIGAYTTLQYQYATIHGLEVSYDLLPRGGAGLGGYLAYTNSLAKPGGLDQTGAPAPEINDHDQRHTISAGLSYTLPSQAFAGVDVYYGSGEASSVLAPIGASNTNVLNNGARNNNSYVNLRIGSPRLANYGGLELDVENVFNTLSVLNFNSGFSGTRFQQGRRVLLTATGSF